GWWCRDGRRDARGGTLDCCERRQRSRGGFAGGGTACARTSHTRVRFRPETWVSGRSLSAGLFALGAPEEHALAARAEDHLCVALDLVEELGWDAHAAALADTAAYIVLCVATVARVDHSVL